MSLREYFAGQALTGLCANPHYSPSLATDAHAVEEADKLLTRLSDPSPVVWAARSPAPEGGETRRAVSRDWVCCPICGEPDMQKETDGEGASLIFCVNHGCRSNGGDNDLQSAPQPDQSELLREVDDLLCLLKWGDRTDEVRDMLTKIREAVGDE